MLGRIILLILQIAACWGAAPIVRGYIPVHGAFDLFVYAVIFALLAFVTGAIAALFVKDVGAPSSGTLTVSLILAIAAAALATFGREFIPPGLSNALSQRGLVLAGALLGYLVKR